MKSRNLIYESDASQIKGKAKKIIITNDLNVVCREVKSNSNITPRGGGSGLVGGAVSNEGIIIDLSKFDKIIDFDEREKTIEVEAGMIIEDLNNFLENYKLEFPIIPTSEGFCTIGGAIATDAVGIKNLKYGKIIKWVNSIEIINANGKIQKKSKSELSDFIGLEGITGIISKVNLNLTEKKNTNFHLIKVNNVESLNDSIKKLKSSSNVTYIGFLDKQISAILGLEDKYHLFIEYETETKSDKDYKKIILLRKNPLMLLTKDFVKIEDVRMFPDKFSELLTWFEQNNIPLFADIGSNITHPFFYKEQLNKIHEMMIVLKRLRGNIRGMYGIGLIKKGQLDNFDLNLYQSIKKRNDPKNKFNPGKII
ncbi:MAG: FAD-binding oxidoreductase [Nanoarchaeota archaeon]